jgi:hypothetical protein
MQTFTLWAEFNFECARSSTVENRSMTSLRPGDLLEITLMRRSHPCWKRHCSSLLFACACSARGSHSSVESLARRMGVEILLFVMNAAPINRHAQIKAHGIHRTDDSMPRRGESRRLEAFRDRGPVLFSFDLALGWCGFSPKMQWEWGSEPTFTRCSTWTVASPEWVISGNPSIEKNNLYSTYRLSIHTLSNFLLIW